MPRTHVAIVLDRSGSMGSIRSETVRAFNKIVGDIREQAKGMPTTVSLFTFSNNASATFVGENVDTLKPLTVGDYYPTGSTALFDGLCMAIEKFDGFSDSDDPTTAFLVITITDGEENNSSERNKSRAPSLLLARQKTDRWTFAFQVPPGHYKAQLAKTFGVPTDNIVEWEGTAAGVQQASVSNTAAVSNYFTARSQGHTNVAAFYVETSLAGVSPEEIKKSLRDIARDFKVLNVEKEMRLDEFVAEKTKKEYVVGSGYYQLMKKETVQPTKAVLIVEKGKKTVWGGPEARRLIGLPDNADAKVTPGNHSNYDIFVQSKSVNRKLPRGTRVLLDVTKTVADKATWDHASAYAAADAKRQAAEANASVATIV